MADEPLFPRFDDHHNRQRKPETYRQMHTIEIPEYKVLIHNDDITPMDFVMQVLAKFFQLNDEQARDVMMKAHLSGVAIVALLPLERAEFKVEQAHSYSRSNNFPLTLTIEQTP